MSGPAGRIDRIVVGIPARDEATSIVACVDSVAAAARRVAVPVHVVVVDDDSSDATADLARASLATAPANVAGQVLTLGCGTAGAARAVAFDRGIAAAGRPGTTWLASTDADTVVGSHWLTHHLRWAWAGLDGVAGLVDVGWRPEQAQLAARFKASTRELGCEDGHAHVHGANLGLRASWWIEVGGCDERADGEDLDLWRRLRAAGARLHGATDLQVVTSSRLVGRVPDGFSGYLRSLRR